MTEDVDARLTRVQERYEQAVFGGDAKHVGKTERDLMALKGCSAE
ncbi:hypothetical protein ABZ780_25305 [Micromonospora sp. NPDC047467]